MNNKKPLVCTLVMLLTLASMLGLFVTVKADVWTDITLPYVISEAGSYRIMGAWSGSGIALTINASDVVVDGQNFLIELTQADEDCAVFIVSGSRNVLLDNINETSSFYGVFAEEVTFTAQNCMFTNNTGAGIFAFSASDFALQDSRLSNNSYGLVALYAGNFSVLGCHVKNNTVGIETIDSANFTLSHLYLNNNSQSFMAQDCRNFNVTDCTIHDSQYGLGVISSGQINVQNCEFNNTAMGFFIGLSNCTFTDSSITNGNAGVEALFCDDFSASNVSITRCQQGFVSFGNNFTLQDFSFNQNYAYNALVLSCNATMKQGLLANGLVGLLAEGDNQLTLEDCIISNNTWFGTFLEYETNTTINSNLFSNNGFDEENTAPLYASALAILDSNCTVSDNLFENNNETLFWSTSTDDVSTTNVFNNNLQNNSYTFCMGDELSEHSTQQFNFYNNLVNDTAYVNPQSINLTGPSAVSEVFHLNTTLQVGHRIINDGGRMIGGNYWAHPNGTGPSQIGVDANTDGFLDEPFDFLGNQTIYDYLPYSSSFIEFIDHLVISPQAATMTVGSSITYTTTAYDQYGNSWEVDAQHSLNDILVSGNAIFGFLPVGVYVVGASYQDVTTATFLTVMPGSTVRFMVYVPPSAAPGEPFNIRITALDVAGNIAAFSGKVTISVNSSSITPATSGTFSWGTWLGTVSIPEEGTFTITVDDGNGHKGTSNSITIAEIIQPTPTPTPTPKTTPTATPDISEGPSQLPEILWYVLIIIVIAMVFAAIFWLTKYRRK
ncbi:MAG: right-handed parallel beta-helix repeat-containing protein [Candidatus Bathyarchaeota archaeon]|nr:right-handed parallel beta-helix repeat-containing protein [Candidatus Bathyarchaeota archaeon]